MTLSIYDFLDNNEIDFQKFNHPAVYTVAEAEKLVPDMPGKHIKNLLLRSKKLTHPLLLVVGGEKRVDLKRLSDELGAGRFSFATPEELQEYLGVEPGSVTLLGLINDQKWQVEVLIDEPVWQAKTLQCHPLVNTATLIISHEGIVKFLRATGHDVKVIMIPEIL